MKSSCNEYVIIQTFKEPNTQTKIPNLNIDVPMWTLSKKAHFRFVQSSEVLC